MSSVLQLFFPAKICYTVKKYPWNVAQEDIREGQLTTILNSPWKTQGVLPPSIYLFGKTDA